MNFGDNGQGTRGPNFQLKDATLGCYLHLTGANVPDTMKVGDNLRVVVAVDGFDPGSCLFLLKPVSTEYR